MDIEISNRFSAKWFSTFLTVILIWILFLYKVSFAQNTIKTFPYNNKEGLKKLLHSESADDINPKWSIDGKYIAFERDSKITPMLGLYYFDVDKLNLSGYEIKPLCRSSDGKGPSPWGKLGEASRQELTYFASYLSWSPNRDNMHSFVYIQNMGIYQGSIKSINPSKDNVKDDIVECSIFGRFKKSDAEVANSQDLDWANGDKIIFVSNRSGGGDIYYLGTKDANREDRLKQLTTEPSLDFQPKSSPDGNKIVYVSKTENSNTPSSICLLDMKSGKRQKLTNSNFDESCPTWSPDGSKIAFYRLNREMGENYFELWVMNVDGSNQKLIDAPVTRQDRLGPTWLPEKYGYKLIYVNNTGEKIFIKDVVSGKWWRVLVDTHINDHIAITLRENKDLLIAYSAVNEENRKRIFIKRLDAMCLE